MVLGRNNNKDEGFDFLSLILLELKKLSDNPINPWIDFSKVHYRLGTIFHIKKDTSWKLIFLLQKRGLIEVNRIKGIRIKGDIDDTNS